MTAFAIISKFDIEGLTMERSHIDVRFAYEYGDKSLPKIKELVCENRTAKRK